MIAASVQRLGRAAEERAPVVHDLLRLSMHRFPRPHHLSPKRLPDALMSQADAEDGHRALRPGKPVQPAGSGDELEAHPGLVGSARPGREHQPLRAAGEDLRGARRVVAQYVHGGAQLAEALHQVEGERVVVVDDEHARLHATAFPATAPYAAPTEARTLASTSRHSEAGSLSATIPAPACAKSRPWLRNKVRMAIASWTSPAPENQPTAPPYGPRWTPSNSSMISIARIFGAPESVPAGNAAAKASTAPSPGFNVPLISLVMCIPWP